MSQISKPERGMIVVRDGFCRDGNDPREQEQFGRDDRNSRTRGEGLDDVQAGWDVTTMVASIGAFQRGGVGRFRKIEHGRGKLSTGMLATTTRHFRFAVSSPLL